MTGRLFPRGAHVLMVSDDPEMRELYESLFVSAGAAVTVENSVENALAVAAQLRPDVVVADFGEQRVIWLLSRMRAVAGLSGIPVVAITASNQQMTVKDGFADVLEHPVDPVNLLARVRGFVVGHEPSS